MATVTGLTADRMLAIEAASIVDGAVLLDHLILTRHDGSEIDAGVVKGDPGTGPTGSIAMFAGAEAPVGHLLCDGSAISRTTYEDLFAVIGITYGIGNGSTTFNVPNLKGKIPVGRDATQTEFDTLGESGGEKAHTLSATEMPSHTHTQNSHTHTQNAHTHIQDAHNHTQNSHAHTTALGSGNQVYTAGLASRGRVQLNATTTNPFIIGSVSDVDGVNYGGFPTTTAVNVAATATSQSATATSQSTTAVNQSTGGGGSHNNLQPYVVLNYIIKT